METVAPFNEIVDEIKAAGGETFKLCYQCGKCDAVCPWNRVIDFSMRRVIREAAFGLTDIEGDSFWRCTTCGRCVMQCPRQVKQIELGVSLRRIATEYQVFPTSVKPVRTMSGSLAGDGNPLNEERSKRGDWAKGLPVKPFTADMEILYFVGCYLSYDARLKKVAVATAEVLNKAGVNFGILGDKESCCGESIRKTGDEEVYHRLATDNIKTFIDHGVKRILVSSPHCYHTLKNEYPDFMVHFEVVHIAEYVGELLAAGRLSLSGDYARRVTWHDPCYLGRHNGIYDEPRDLLDQVNGLQRLEMADNRADSLCCGGGGGRIWMETAKAERFSDLRVKQAQNVEAEVLATSCPYCITNFEESRLSLDPENKLEIKDISEIIAEVI